MRLPVIIKGWNY